MLFDKGFAPLGELKARLGIKDSDDDTLLTEILTSTAATIEGIAGRTLRRDHGRTEIHSGGDRTIRLALEPIAKIHEIRESADRDFQTASKFTELVEGTDFVMEAGEGGRRPGDSGVVRRIGADWLGDKLNSSGQIRVIYTAGFKTDDEIDIENATTTINSVNKIDDFRYIPLSGTITRSQENAAQIGFNTVSSGLIQARAFIRFDTEGLLFPIWNLIFMALDTYLSKTGDIFLVATFLMTIDALLADSQVAWDDVGDNVGDVVLASEYTPNLFVSSATPSKVTFQGIAQGKRDNFALTTANGHLSFAIQSADIDTGGTLESTESVTVGERPVLKVTHAASDGGSFNVPGDLRQANLLQSVHEFQTRKIPGIVAAAQRGTTIASGASLLKTVSQVLPQVVGIASRYRRFY